MHVRSKRSRARSFPVRRIILWVTVAMLGAVAIAAIAISNRSAAPVRYPVAFDSSLAVADKYLQGGCSDDRDHRTA